MLGAGQIVQSTSFIWLMLNSKLYTPYTTRWWLDRSIVIDQRLWSIVHGTHCMRHGKHSRNQRTCSVDRTSCSTESGTCRWSIQHVQCPMEHALCTTEYVAGATSYQTIKLPTRPSPLDVTPGRQGPLEFLCTQDVQPRQCFDIRLWWNVRFN